MVEPEVDHDLLQLTPAQQGSKNPRLGGLLDDGPCALALHLLQFGRQLNPTDGGQRSVKLPELRGVIAKIVHRSGGALQCEGFGNFFGIELLSNVAVDPDRLNKAEIFERRTEGEPVQDMDDLAIGHRFGAGDLQHGQTDQQVRRRENSRISRRHEIWLPPLTRIRRARSCASILDPPGLETLWPSPKLSHSSVLRSIMAIRLIRGIGPLAPRYDGIILDLWGCVLVVCAPLP